MDAVGAGALATMADPARSGGGAVSLSFYVTGSVPPARICLNFDDGAAQSPSLALRGSVDGCEVEARRWGPKDSPLPSSRSVTSTLELGDDAPGQRRLLTAVPFADSLPLSMPALTSPTSDRTSMYALLAPQWPRGCQGNFTSLAAFTGQALLGPWAPLGLSGWDLLEAGNLALCPVSASCERATSVRPASELHPQIPKSVALLG